MINRKPQAVLRIDTGAFSIFLPKRIFSGMIPGFRFIALKPWIMITLWVILTSTKSEALSPRLSTASWIVYLRPGETILHPGKRNSYNPPWMNQYSNWKRSSTSLSRHDIKGRYQATPVPPKANTPPKTQEYPADYTDSQIAESDNWLYAEDHVFSVMDPPVSLRGIGFMSRTPLRSNNRQY